MGSRQLSCRGAAGTVGGTSVLSRPDRGHRSDRRVLGEEVKAGIRREGREKARGGMREELALLAVVVYIVRPESPAVHGVLVVRLALVEARVLLGRGVDLHLGLDGVVADRPLVHLRTG